MSCEHPQPKVWEPSSDLQWCERCGAIRMQSKEAWVFPEVWSPPGVATMDTFRGHRINILEPRSLDVDVHDIAHHLAMQVRFNGAIRFFYGVGEHSNNVAVSVFYRLLGRDVPDPRKRGFPDTIPADFNPRRFWGAVLRAHVHDGSEAYLGDCIRPLKSVLPIYKAIEQRHMDAIHEHLGFGPDEDWAWADELVDKVDKHVYRVENHVLRNGEPVEEHGVEFVHRHDWEAVRDEFLSMSEQLIHRFRAAV